MPKTALGENDLSGEGLKTDRPGQNDFQDNRTEYSLGRAKRNSMSLVAVYSVSVPDSVFPTAPAGKEARDFGRKADSYRGNKDGRC